MKHTPKRDFETKSAVDPDPTLAALATLGQTVESKMSAFDAEVKSLATRLDTELAKANRPGATSEKNGDGELEAKAFDKFVRQGREALAPDEIKSLRVSDDTQGGFLAPAEFIAELDRNLVLFSPVRSVARVMNTSKSIVRMPKRTSGLTAKWVGEVEDRPATQPAFGQSEYPVGEISGYVDVSNAMLEDSEFDVAELLSFEFAEDFGAKEGTAFVTGDNVNKPLGFLASTALSFTVSGHATTIPSADSLITLYHDLKAPYRRNAVWMMNSATLGVVRKMKDTSGAYLLTNRYNRRCTCRNHLWPPGVGSARHAGYRRKRPSQWLLATSAKATGSSTASRCRCFVTRIPKLQTA